ncbi:MAG: ATP-binding protein [Paludibacteraceae bacterium]|nr:ATP-binding protein [Paludibacteraceae bacterium]
MKTIGIIGPESTGKTTLAQRLAQITRCHWEPELARDYVERLQRPYTEQDVQTIARHQIEREMLLREQMSASAFVFFDTETIITQVWMEHAYGYCPDFLSRHIQNHPMDMYLLCCPDITWEPDPVRENGHIREQLMKRYTDLVRKTNRPFAFIQGQGDERIHAALRAIGLADTGQIG